MRVMLSIPHHPEVMSISRPSPRGSAGLSVCNCRPKITPMWSILLFFSALLIAASLLARWFMGIRVLANEGVRPCRCDLGRWLPAPADDAKVQRADATAAEFGRQLREKALADWAVRDPKAAAARESSRRFGMAVPPLAGIIAIFALLVAKILPVGALAIFFAATALSAAFGLLSLSPELRAIAVAARKTRETRVFVRRDDEDAVITCAVAHAWKETLPPVLAMVQR